jgi:hypothetical protein
MLILRSSKMPDFYTPVTIPPAPFEIDFASKVFFMGSCFAENIGRCLQADKFRVCCNPFGVVYNPLALSGNLMKLIEKDRFTEDDLSFYNELWFSYSHYTLFSDTTREACLDRINGQFLHAKKFIAQADVLFLTLGTSWAYRLKETGEIVANCHRIPASKFDRFNASVSEMVGALTSSVNALRKTNPSLKVVFTVSPIRHWKDGAIENQRSKAALILTVAAIQNNLTGIYYFPAYEIMIDELRDYRFYAADKLHPSEEAKEYLWEKFISAFLRDETKEILRNVERILNSVKHKPRFPSTKAFQKFIDDITENIRKLRKEYPFLDFNDELTAIGKV